VITPRPYPVAPVAPGLPPTSRPPVAAPPVARPPAANRMPYQQAPLTP
jgi:hypothetical protein